MDIEEQRNEMMVRDVVQLQHKIRVSLKIDCKKSHNIKELVSLQAKGLLCLLSSLCCAVLCQMPLSYVKIWSPPSLLLLRGTLL